MFLGRSASKAVRRTTTTLLQNRIPAPSKLQLLTPTTIIASTPWPPVPSHRRPMSSSSTPRTSAGKRRPNPKLRVHAVSIPHGDYTYNDPDDNDDYEDDDQFSFPNEDDENQGWDIVPNSPTTTPPTTTGNRKLDAQAAAALAHQKKIDARRARWIASARPPIRVREIDDHGRSYGRGGRKTSTARVWIQPGEGVVTVNRREFLDFFPRESDREMVLSPFVASRTCGQFDVTVAVEGGGVTGKAGAVRHGVARALEKYDPEYRPPMKRLGFMTRDPRKVERKKVGLKKARKAPQWVRR